MFVLVITDLRIVYTEYVSLFQTTFGNLATSPASSKKAFAFLIKFLTDVVPFETALYLKVTRGAMPSQSNQ